MNYGHSSITKEIKSGSGLLSVERHAAIVARAVGDRSEKTCRELWNTIPDEYRNGHCFTDFWQAYQLVIPQDQLTQVGKETGETAHVERWNCTLRQRIGRFIRKTLSFSKSIFMHIICLDLFLHRYNLDRAILLG